MFLLRHPRIEKGPGTRPVQPRRHHRLQKRLEQILGKRGPRAEPARQTGAEAGLPASSPVVMPLRPAVSPVGPIVRPTSMKVAAVAGASVMSEGEAETGPRAITPGMAAIVRSLRDAVSAMPKAGNAPHGTATRPAVANCARVGAAVRFRVTAAGVVMTSLCGLRLEGSECQYGRSHADGCSKSAKCHDSLLQGVCVITGPCETYRGGPGGQGRFP